MKQENPVTHPSFRDEALSIDAQGFGSGPSLFEKNMAVINHLHLLWQKIDGPLYYRDELKEKKISGTVRVRILLYPQGNLRRLFLQESSGPSELRGWVATVLLEALEEPFFKKPLNQSLELDLNFYFKIHPDKSFYEQGEDIDSGTLNFYVNAVVSSPYDVTNGQAFVTAYDALRGSQQKESRSDGNVEERLEFYKYECEVKRAEGGCREAAKLYQRLGMHDEANKYSLR